MATRYDIIYQVCSDAAGEHGYFVITVPVWVYGTAEYADKIATFLSAYGTEAVPIYRNDPMALTEAGAFIFNNFPHMGDGLINIVTTADNFDPTWYNLILSDAGGITPNKSSYFEMLPITSSTATVDVHNFYLRRLADSQVFGPMWYTHNTAQPLRGNFFNSHACIPSLDIGSGTGSASLASQYATFKGLYIVTDDFNGVITDDDDVHYSIISGYLGSNPLCSTSYSHMFENVATSTDAALLLNAPPMPPSSDDPYEQGGNSGTGGGGGTFDLSSDAVDFPALPTLTAVSTGLVSVYVPTLSQLNDLADFMWNANITNVDWWKKLVANPLDLILGLSIVPVAVPAGATQNIKVGLIDTGVSVTRAATQFVEVDCGSITINEVYGAALDYSPFTKFSIYLPFIGTRTISTDDVMKKTIHIKYHIDLLSGACTAMVKCGDAVLYQYSGACAVSLPLTGETFTSMITSTIQLAASVFATAASGGAAAGVTAANAANSVMSMKPSVERAGGVSGAAGQLGVMYPYLIAEVPRQSKPENLNEFIGYPSNIKAKLSELSGFTTVDVIHFENVTATNAEKEELERILKEGVIL